MISNLRQHPALTGTLGTVTGWASVDLLNAAQFAAAALAALVSLDTLIIIAPKVWAQLCAWCKRRG